MQIDELKELVRNAGRQSAECGGKKVLPTDEPPVTWPVIEKIVGLLEAQQKELLRLDSVKLQAVSFNQRALEELIRQIVNEEFGRREQ